MDETLNRKRHLELQGANNVRDLGGYHTRDGGSTRWGRFLRADTLHLLSPEAQTVLLDYGVDTVIDLRQTNETQSWPDVFARSPAVQYHHLNMIGDEEPEIEPLPQEAERPQQVAHVYCGWLDKCQEAVGSILGTLANGGNQATLYHCAAGKDRTGVISGLLLSLAGVPEETIAADYGLSARYLVGPFQSSPEAVPEIRTWADYQRAHCPPEAMLLVLDHLERNYGGVEGYLRTVGLSKDQIVRLRDALVE